jgi:hypothetical protein
MQSIQGSHCTDEALEQYAMERLEESALPEFEEHVLICEHCQGRLDDFTQYAGAARAAAQALRRKPPKRARSAIVSLLPSVPTPVWIGAFAVFSFVLLLPRSETPSAPAEAVLATARGAEAGLSTSIRAGGPVMLRLEVGELQASPKYRLQIVNAEGREVWSGEASPADHQLAAIAPIRIQPGRYWVRVYPPSGSRNPLREYGLEAR